MDLVYYDVYQNKALEDYVAAYGAFLASRGERAVTVKRAASVEEVLTTADVVSLHTVSRLAVASCQSGRRAGMLREPA